MALLLGKRVQLIGSILRNRDDQFKADLISELRQHVWPLFEERRLQPRLERAFPARDAEAAFETLASNQVEGKLVLVLDESLA
ncbi:putative NAD(P)H quinone oxidoreductase, PIG3 family [compost metagenome]